MEVSEEHREVVRSELTSIAEWVKARYPSMKYNEIRRFISDMVDVSV